jgi:integrase
MSQGSILRKFPIRLHEKHGGFYYVFKNKWTLLSRDYAEALRLYAPLVEKKRSGSIPDFIDRWIEKRKKDKKHPAANTLRAYGTGARKLKVAFSEFNPEDFKPKHFYQWVAGAKITDAMAQLYRSVMVGTMQLAVEEGRIDFNPMREVKNWQGGQRNRYLTDAEYLAIRDKANPTLKAIITISLQTGQRIGDVLKILYSDISDAGLYVQQEKTGEKMRLEWTQDLKDAIANARAVHTSVKGMTLFSTKQGKPLPYSTVRDWWRKATKLAGIENGNMHDIRAKAATDADEQGMNSMALLGHRSEKTHQRYLRGKKIPLVQPLPMVKS